MNVLRKEKKEEEEGGNMYMTLEKTTVLQEARTFNDSPLNPRKCATILTKILAVLTRGDKLGKNEATEAFFAMTKLFQSKDQKLRQMVYLCIKEMAVIADDVIIVTSSLTKDMTGPEIAFRAPAIRALCKITDLSMLQGIERYMKQAIVDKSPSIASAALASAVHLMRLSPDVVRRWSNEVQEAANSERIMVQYHALGLLYQIRRVDRLAVMKMVQKFAKSSIRSPFAHCLMVRIASKQIEDEGLRDNVGLFEFLESSLRHKSEMVIYEAARAIVNLREASAKELAPAISVLQLFCSSHKPAMRYAAVRTLNTVAIRHPNAVTACNLDLEQLITDPNRSIATLAITTLLKTGNENSVDRLLKQIGSFMSEITDEFKVVVVESIRSLASKYPRKYTAMLTFLSGLLRDNTGYKFKKAIVSTIESIIREIPEAKNTGLLHLCEFIEDCEHVKLTQRILHLIGQEGPQLKRPRRFIRYIYNRIMLESAPVRCTATTALARFGAHNEELTQSVLVLLQRIMMDEDDEVRDRATFFHSILSQGNKQLNAAYILTELQLSPSGLERALLHYTQDPGSHEKPFDLRVVPVATAAEIAAAHRRAHGEMSAELGLTGAGSASGVVGAATTGSGMGTGALAGGEKGDLAGGGGASISAAAGSRQQEAYAEELAAIPQLAALNLGPLFKSSVPVELTESETEYVVSCIKHTFVNNIVLEFICENTMEDQVLTGVYLASEPDDSEFCIEQMVTCPRLAYRVPGKVYLCIRLPPAERTDLVSVTFTNTLKFVVKEAEAEDDSGYADEYQLEELTIGIADSVQRVMKTNFSAAWEELGPDNEIEETYALTKCKSVEETIKLLVEHVGMQPCDRTDRPQEGKSSHLLLLAGVFRGGHEVLVRCKIVVGGGSDQGVTLQLVVRASDPNVSRIVADTLG